MRHWQTLVAALVAVVVCSGGVHAEESEVKLSEGLMALKHCVCTCTWEIVKFQDFQDGCHDWSDCSTSDCGGRPIMGGFGKFAAGQVFTMFENLPEHQYVRVKANYYFIDKWDGESGFLKVDDEYAWVRMYTQPKEAWNVCGNDQVGDAAGEAVDVVVPHTQSQLKLDFGSNLSKGAYHASWGVGDVLLALCVTDRAMCEKGAGKCSINPGSFTGL
eukprot:GFYU01005846.1.p1 GENE.GFYU01005846.1~~GFYU01005846.1.p1  ORF type:complete len:216 (-),score=37.50 GFYU01005846.1:269-916(-)